jgi:glycosyltransferase involved in cell wall biosynthesis
MWLYLSLGKPVVLTDMPNINSWVFEDKLVYKCDNKDFIDYCILAYKDDCPELVSKRIQLAKDNSWENRVKRIKELYYGIKD